MALISATTSSDEAVNRLLVLRRDGSSHIGSARSQRWPVLQPRSGSRIKLRDVTRHVDLGDTRCIGQQRSEGCLDNQAGIETAGSAANLRQRSGARSNLGRDVDRKRQPMIVREMNCADTFSV